MKSRESIELNERFNKRWLGYTVVGATGVGMLASTPLAGDDIIYTPTNTNVPANTTLSTDLNHDGIDDFILDNAFYFDCLEFSGATCVSWAAGGRITASGAQLGNGIVLTTTSLGRNFAAEAKGRPGDRPL